MIAPSRVREGAGRIGFPLATWEGTKVQPKPAASRMLYLRSAIASTQDDGSLDRCSASSNSSPMFGKISFHLRHIVVTALHQTIQI
jgi:hypothetical protein